MKKIKEILNKYHHPSAPADLEILIARAIGKNKEFVLAHPEYCLPTKALQKLNSHLRLYAKGYSIAAITGHKEFYGLDFLVDKYVLIPRPETETMVEIVLAEINKSAGKQILVDIGTGSGCIPISILKNYTGKNIIALAVDKSAKASAVAKKNAKKQKVKIKFLRGNLLAPFIRQINHLTGKRIDKLIITANLPYLTAKQFASESSIRKEPKIALIADNKNGLSLYEKLFQQINQLPKFNSIFIIIEIDPRQSKKATALSKKYFPDHNIEIKKDLSGKNRFVIIR